MISANRHQLPRGTCYKLRGAHETLRVICYQAESSHSLGCAAQRDSELSMQHHSWENTVMWEWKCDSIFECYWVYWAQWGGSVLWRAIRGQPVSHSGFNWECTWSVLAVSPECSRESVPHQKVNRSGSYKLSSVTLQSSLQVLLTNSIYFQARLQYSMVLSDDTRRFWNSLESTCCSGGMLKMLYYLTYRIVKWWKSWDFWTGVVEMLRTAETSVQLWKRLYIWCNTLTTVSCRVISQHRIRSITFGPITGTTFDSLLYGL